MARYLLDPSCIIKTLWPLVMEIGRTYDHPYLNPMNTFEVQMEMSNGDKPLANARQEGGKHYSDGVSIQTWDFIIDHKLNYLEGNVIKYVDRHRKKNKKEDLLKARHYLDKLIESEYGMD